MDHQAEQEPFFLGEMLFETAKRSKKADPLLSASPFGEVFCCVFLALQVQIPLTITPSSLVNLR
jgi:hypothetical protein